MEVSNSMNYKQKVWPSIVEKPQFKNFRWCELRFNELRTNRFWKEFYHQWL